MLQVKLVNKCQQLFIVRCHQAFVFLDEQGKVLLRHFGNVKTFKVLARLFDLDNTATRLGTIGFDVGKFNKFHNFALFCH